MRLEKFRVTHYRSVRDSGWISVGDQTALVGRNESGKSNLLLALRSLKPPDHLERLPVSTDFPADLPRTEYNDELDVVQTVWRLSDEQREHLATLFPRASQVERVEIGRGYEPLRWVRFPELPAAEAPIGRAKELFTRLASADGDGEENAEEGGLRRALDRLETAIGASAEDPRAWAQGVRDALVDARQRAEARSTPLSESARDALSELRELADQVGNDTDAENTARDWLLEQLPSFLYLDEYPEIQGHQDLAAFLERKRENRSREGDEYFEKLLTVAGLDVESLETLLHADHETRRQIANRAGAVVTRKLRELWHERALKVRFNLDGEHFNTLISDPNSIYDVEVNLNERSRGFRWFFSFYVTFAAEAKVGATDNMVLLLDEPGLYLHALGQRDLLAHFKADFPNQVVYTTHSPFMVPADDLGAVRTVTISEEDGTQVGERPSGDAKTLFPILHSLGMEISQNLFGDGRHLVVSEITDYWFLRATSDFVRSRSGRGLPHDLHITPAGGCAKLPYMVALLSGQRPSALVLMTDDAGAEAGELGLEVAKLLPRENLVHVAGALDPERAGGADLEDLIDPQLYDRFVRYCWRNELKDKTFELDPSIPRIVDRYTRALAGLGLEFSRVRPARLFLRGMGKNPTSVLPKTTRERFERLFVLIQERMQSLGG